MVLTNLGGSNFNLNSLDVGEGFDGSPASFVITGYLSDGGTLVSNVVDAGAFTNLVLGWSNLTKVEFQSVGSNFGAIDNINVNAVPIPAAAWLFGTALIGLVGFSKRRKAT